MQIKSWFHSPAFKKKHGERRQIGERGCSLSILYFLLLHIFLFSTLIAYEYFNFFLLGNLFSIGVYGFLNETVSMLNFHVLEFYYVKIDNIHEVSCGREDLIFMSYDDQFPLLKVNTIEAL